LTISAAESVTGGATINMQGGTLNASLGLTVTSGTLTGFGTVNGAFSGTGTGTGIEEASGGTLDLKSAIAAATGLNYAISSSAIATADHSCAVFHSS
jgi:large repetitive protein